LGRLSKVMDNHFHPVAGDRHRRPESKPVVLEAGVTLGPRAIVLPGAHLEAGVSLGPGVVVSRRVKAGLSLVGSPPRVERRAP
jgi:acetyltransferase-like isoleucine patch superfamily enzyme